jgi:hypothetical protein
MTKAKLLKMSKVKALGLMLALTLVVSGALSCSAIPDTNPDTEITSLPFTADSADTRYYLSSDLTCATPSAAGITIAAEGVTIDGQGYKITGSATNASCEWADKMNPATASGVYSAGYDDVVIENLEIEGFCTGIALKGTGGNLVEDNTIDSCTIHDNGFDTMSGGSDMVTHGIHACFIGVLNVTNNTVYDNEGTGSGCDGGGNGIFILAGNTADENAVISNNTLYGNAMAGFLTANKLSASTISYNEAYENGNGAGVTGSGRGGIVLLCKATNNNTVNNNNSHDNYGDGIIVGGNNNILEYNTSSDNTGNGIHMNRSDGSDNNVLNSNLVCDNGGTDIVVVSGKTCTGDENTCDSTSNYDDDGATGCTYVCEEAERQCRYWYGNKLCL